MRLAEEAERLKLLVFVCLMTQIVFIHLASFCLLSFISPFPLIPPSHFSPPSPDCLHPHMQLPHKPNPGVSTGKCTAGRSGRQRQAEFDPAGCLHLQPGGFPDYLEKRIQHHRPQGFTAKKKKKKHSLQQVTQTHISSQKFNQVRSKFKHGNTYIILQQVNTALIFSHSHPGLRHVSLQNNKASQSQSHYVCHSPISLLTQNDLASVYIKAGVKNIATVFLMTDAQVADEKFLVLVNDLLASGNSRLC